jgi:uncharacterized protein YbjQ (UPF0145 family)
MTCQRCGKDFPSTYYFAVEGICHECFAKLSSQERVEARRPVGIERMTTTAFTVDGYRVTQTLGLVRGITVRSRSVIGTIGAALQSIVGGEISLFTELCERTRQEAFRLMLVHATEMGANAVIGVRYDANEVMDGITEVLCYGTAVVVEPVAPQA